MYLDTKMKAKELILNNNSSIQNYNQFTNISDDKEDAQLLFNMIKFSNNHITNLEIFDNIYKK